MADAAVVGGSRSDRALERLGKVAGLLAAVAGAVTGMWTIYEKVRTDARSYTAASYETLAPQVNQMAEAIKTLEQQNQQLHQALVAEHPRTARKAAASAQQAGTSPKEAGTSPAPGAPAAPVATAPAEAPDDALGRLLGAAQETRAAVEAVRKVPDSFQKVLEQKGKK